jgi:hypothetical protein
MTRRPVRSLAVSAVLVLFVAGLGVWPHARFSAALGHPAFFKGAYDEDTYVLWWWNGLTPAHRTLSEAVMNVLSAVSGRDIDTVLIAADAVLPAMAMVCAFALASRIVAANSLRMLAALMLLFGQDLLSGGNLAVWSGHTGPLDVLRSWLNAPGRSVVPSYETSYLMVFRTPEPQVGFCVFLLLLGLLVTAAREPTRCRGWVLAGLVLANALAGMSYLFLSVPAFVLELGLIVVLLAARETRAAAAVGSGVAVGLLVLGFGLRSQSLGQGHALFASRLVVVTPAVLAGLLTSAVLLVWMLTGAHRTPLAWLTLGVLMMPAVLTNQQVLTGMMVSARDWERNANYPFLITGWLLAATLVQAAIAESRWRWVGSAAVVASVMVVLVVAAAQWRAYRFWTPTNAISVAMTRALDRGGDVAPGTPLVLSPPEVAPLLRVRTRDRHSMLLDYTLVMEHPVAPLTPRGAQAESPHERRLFEYWWRTGATPETVEATVSGEIARGGGSFLAYLFSERDFWPPMTDNRLVRRPELLALVPALVGRYRAFVADPPRDARREAVVLVAQPRDAPRPDSGPRRVPLSVGEALGYRAFAFRQAL